MFFISCLFLLSSHCNTMVNIPGRVLDSLISAHVLIIFLDEICFLGGWTLSHTRCSGEIAATRRLRGKAFFTKVLTEWTDAPGNISTAKVRKGVRDANTKEEEEGTRRLRDDAFYWHTEPEERGEEYWWAVNTNSWALRGRLPATRLLQTPGFSKFPAHKLPPSRSDCLVHTDILSRRPTDRWMDGWIR